MTSPAVHSEDDNFIVGSGDNYDRLRRDARQLHLSAHNETRSKAHFARFRNAALKCSMETTHKRVDQEKSLALREHERAQAVSIKRQQRYVNSKVSYLPNITNKKSSQSNRKDLQNSASKSPKKEKLPKEKDQSLSDNSWNRGEISSRDKNDMLANHTVNIDTVSETGQENSWMYSTSALDNGVNRKDDSAKKISSVSFYFDRENSWMSGQASSSVDAIKRVTLNEKKPKSKQKTTSLTTTSADELASSQSSNLTASRADTLSTNSDITLDLPNSSTKERRTSGHSFNQSGQRLYRASSSKSLRIYPANDLSVRRSNSISSERHVQREMKKDEKIWRDFDGLLKWFSDYLGKEYKPSYVNTHHEEPTGDTHAQDKKKALLPKCSMSPLYFKFGVPENGVIRLC